MGRLIILARYWNDMDMLQASLNQIEYWMRDIDSEVYLAEGAWDQKLDRRSTDGTRELLIDWAGKKNGRNKKGCRELVTIIDNVRENQNYRINQANTSNQVMLIADWRPDDWMMIVDADHFYTKAAIDFVKETIQSDRYDFFAYKVCNFFYDLQHCQETIDSTQSRLPSRLVEGSRWRMTNHLTANGVFYRDHLRMSCKNLIDTHIQGLHYEGLRPKSRLDLRYSVGNRKSFWEFDNGSRLKNLVTFTGQHSEFVKDVLNKIGAF